MRGFLTRGSVSGLLLGLLFLAGIAATWLSPQPPDRQEDVAGARLLPPLTFAHAIRLEPDRTMIVTALRAAGPALEFERAGARRRVAAASLIEAPSPRFYLLGTDALGRDLASRLLHAIRNTFLTAGLSTAIALALGLATGGFAGLAGRGFDSLVMRSVDAMMAVPRLLVYIVCAALFRPSTALLVLILGATTWTGIARLVRAEVLAFKASDEALSAAASGATPGRLLARHLIPRMAPVLSVATALRFADIVVLESALGFLGLGVPPPAISLGEIVASGRDVLAEAWWVAAWPVLLIMAVVVSLRPASALLFSAGEPPSAA